MAVALQRGQQVPGRSGEKGDIGGRKRRGREGVTPAVDPGRSLIPHGLDGRDDPIFRFSEYEEIRSRRLDYFARENGPVYAADPDAKALGMQRLHQGDNGFQGKIRALPAIQGGGSHQGQVGPHRRRSGLPRRQSQDGSVEDCSRDPPIAQPGAAPGQGKGGPEAVVNPVPADPGWVLHAGPDQDDVHLRKIPLPAGALSGTIPCRPRIRARIHVIEVVLIVFLLLVALTATVAVKVGFRAIDYMAETRARLKRLEEGQERLLGGRGVEKDGEPDV